MATHSPVCVCVLGSSDWLCGCVKRGRLEIMIACTVGSRLCQSSILRSVTTNLHSWSPRWHCVWGGQSDDCLAVFPNTHFMLNLKVSWHSAHNHCVCVCLMVGKIQAQRACGSDS